MHKIIIKKTANLSMEMTNQPLVSIIMAAKDTAAYLPECLNSILAQTYTNWELIAVNDHSIDATPEILHKYAKDDKRIRVYHSNKPRLIPSLQVGYAQARGSLINRMDSDDKMPHYKLQVLVDEWLKHGRGTVVAGGTEHFVDEGKVGGGFLKYEKWLNELAGKGIHYQQIYKECVIPSHCWIIHKDDFDLVDSFNPLVYPEDYDLCFRFYKHGLRVVGIDKILHYWRDRSDRISRTWAEYKDNRYFDLKIKYFYELDRDRKRPLVVWGAGKHGKDLVKRLLTYEDKFQWVCNNQNKIGRDIYNVNMQHFNAIPEMDNPQILIAVTSDDEVVEINNLLNSWNKMPVKDFWFFL